MKHGLELLEPMFQGKLPERVPVILNLFEQGANELNLSIEEYYSDVDHIVEGQVRMAEKFGHDNLWATFYAAIDAETLGSKKTIFSDDGPPNVGQLIIRQYADVDELTIPGNINDSPFFSKQTELVKKLKKKAAGRLPVCAYVVASFSLPVLLMGIDRWLTLLLTGSSVIREALLAKCSEFVIKKIMALREAGADMIAYANPIASATFIKAHQFDKLAAKWISSDFKGAGSRNLVYFGGGGKIEPFLERIIDSSDAGAYYLNPFDDIVSAKVKVGPRGLVTGAINDIKLMSWSSGQIRAEVKQIMDKGKPNGGFLFGTQMMPYKISDKNIHIMVKAAHEYGRY
ncbi:MAG: hypothetical protein L3J69_03190 [Desulfobacula sp.]|nr:hypothetical protein [Desulfobacula sp.]